jgi:hypothetical protein
MQRTSLLLLALVAAGGFAPANLLTNGDFEQPLETGWTQTVNNAAGAGTFERTDTLGQPTPGYAARVRKDLAYYASLSQTVSVPGSDLELRLDGRLRIGGGSSTCWPVAAVILHYRDAAGTSLGNSRIYLHNQYCTWVSGDTQHLIDITTPDVWTEYSLDVRNEIAANLPGINPDAVRKVTVDLFAYDNGT